MAIFTVNNHYS